jgi:hypothetical protein
VAKVRQKNDVCKDFGIKIVMITIFLMLTKDVKQISSKKARTAIAAALALSNYGWRN